MRDFSAIRSALGLERYLASPLGTLYITPNAKKSSRLLVRHLDSELPASLVGQLASFIREAQHWIERQPALEGLVRVEQPTEVGRDFVARKHHTYFTDISDYTGRDDAPEAPGELAPMREAFRAARSKATTPKDALIATVLARSLLEPTGKTYFDNEEGRFIVVEPKPTPEELRRWAQL